jgi:2-keto-4-pentenoate hydratase
VPFTPDTDLALEGVGLFVNGTLKASGIGAEIMGGPLRSICWLARHAAERGEVPRAGEIIIPGSAVKLVSVSPGETIEACFTRIGSCTARLT